MAMAVGGTYVGAKTTENRAFSKEVKSSLKKLGFSVGRSVASVTVEIKKQKSTALSLHSFRVDVLQNSEGSQDPFTLRVVAYSDASEKPFEVADGGAEFADIAEVLQKFIPSMSKLLIKSF